MPKRPLYDVVALLARLGVGVVFMAHGWQKIDAGITTTSDQFEAMDVPAPTAAATYATFVEFFGGIALIAGVLLPVAAILLFLDMAGAFAIVHADKGLFFVDGGEVKGGYELVLVLGLACLLFAAGGGGRLTVDRAAARMWSRHKREQGMYERRGAREPGGYEARGGTETAPTQGTRPTVPQQAAAHRGSRRAALKQRWSRRKTGKPGAKKPDARTVETDMLVAGGEDRREDMR